MDREDRDYEEEENIGSDSSTDSLRHQRKPHKGGRIMREEPSNLGELQASQLAITCFRNLRCYEFCGQLERVQHHPKLTRLFVAHLQDNKVTLSGVTFIVLPSIITDATRISNVGENWYKAQDLDEHYYEPYIKPWYKNEVKILFPFRFLEDKYVPMTKIIIKYFTCENPYPQ